VCVRLYAPVSTFTSGDWEGRTDSHVCAALICCLIPFTEGTAPFTNVQKVGIAPLLANAGIACGLNVASMSVIRAAGSLTLTLSGYIKVSTTFASC
jgi:hypothetical protein